VALEATFRELSVSLHQLHDALNALQVTLGDKPPEDESALADSVETAVLDLMGTLHEARRASLNARKAVGHPPDLDQARRSLTICQERFHRIEQQFADLVSLREAERAGEAGQRTAGVAPLGQHREARHRAMPDAAGANQHCFGIVLAGTGRAGGDHEHLDAGDECWTADHALSIPSWGLGSGGRDLNNRPLGVQLAYRATGAGDQPQTGTERTGTETDRGGRRHTMPLTVTDCIVTNNSITISFSDPVFTKTQVGLVTGFKDPTPPMKGAAAEAFKHDPLNPGNYQYSIQARRTSLKSRC